MNLYGEGGPRDLNKAEIFYNKSVTINPSLSKQKGFYDFIVK